MAVPAVAPSTIIELIRFHSNIASTVSKSCVHFIDLPSITALQKLYLLCLPGTQTRFFKTVYCGKARASITSIILQDPVFTRRVF